MLTGRVRGLVNSLLSAMLDRPNYTSSVGLPKKTVRGSLNYGMGSGHQLFTYHNPQ